MIFLDTETCGLHSVMVLLQWAKDDGPINLHEVWKVPICDTLALIEMICEEGVIGFNLSFDWFHIVKTYTILTELGRRVGFDKYPEDFINEYAECEPIARDGDCVKPKTALDLMLHARKGPYQSTMDRKPIYIRRVPAVLAGPLVAELERRLPFKEIYFARRKDKKQPKWEILPIKRADGTFDPDFRHIRVNFKPSSALKVLAVDALNLDPKDVTLFADVEVDKKFRPIEFGYAPYALAVSTKEKNWRAEIKYGNKKRKGYAWPGVVKRHIAHWAYNESARKYGTKDVELTRQLYYKFGRPACGDDDSILACMVASVRWRGFSVDIARIKGVRAKALDLAAKAPKSPKKVFQFIAPALSEIERAVLQQSTDKVTLEKIKDMKDHPAAPLAAAVLDARKGTKRAEVCDKLILAGRFHASFKVIGAFSGRMSGADDLNAQGVDHSKEMRSCFTLGTEDLPLGGGDFAAFEVSIADALYDDPNFRAALLTCSKCKFVNTPDDYRKNHCAGCNSNGDVFQKTHGLFGMALSGLTYDEVVATKGQDPDWYDKGKRGFFGKQYGGNYMTLVNRLKIDEEVAKAAERKFDEWFVGVAENRKKILLDFGAMSQEAIGKVVEWKEPKEYVESMTGFKRYFTVENQIRKALYGLANKIPPSWQRMQLTCVRRDREQRVDRAVMSALLGAAFNIQSTILRAAENHRIQSTGAIKTKELQCRIWTLQPAGVKPWVVQPMNIHDEIMTPAKKELKAPIREIVNDFIEENKVLIPLIKIDWEDNLKTWAEKG